MLTQSLHLRKKTQVRAILKNQQQLKKKNKQFADIHDLCIVHLMSEKNKRNYCRDENCMIRFSKDLKKTRNRNNQL